MSTFKDIYILAKDAFSLKLYIKTVLLFIILICVEYVSNIFTEANRNLFFDNRIFIVHFAQYSISYFLAVLVLLGEKQNVNKLKLEFWVKSFIGIAILSLHVPFYDFAGIIRKIPVETRIFYYYTGGHLWGIVTTLIPLLILYLIYDNRHKYRFYGLNWLNRKVLFAVVMSVLCFLFAFFAVLLFDNIKAYYPLLNRTEHSAFAGYIGIPDIYALILFYISYILDLFLVELFFRGFLILGLIKFLGKNCILPAAVLYAVFHFGKPVSEVLSSFLGAYLLGLYVLKYKNIRLPIILHCILALSVDYFAGIW